MRVISYGEDVEELVRVDSKDWDPSHDYEATWDYEVVAPSDEMLGIVKEIVVRLESGFLRRHGLTGVRVEFIAGLECEIGRYASGTRVSPVVMLDERAIRETSDECGVALNVAVETTILHELRHAMSENADEGIDEKAAEEFAWRNVGRF